MQLPTTGSRRQWAFLALVGLLTAFAFQGSRGLFSSTEGRYAEVAREMLETGNYLEPTLNYAPHWSKPPLAYWAMAAGMKIFGVNEWGGRFFNAVAFFLTVLAVARIGTILWDETTGFIAGSIYATSPFPAIGAFCASTDTLLTFWEILAVLCYVESARPRSAPIRYRLVAGMWLSFGLGFLTKGPPALLPLVPIFIWHVRTGRTDRPLNLPGLLLFVGVSMAWYLAVANRHPGLLYYFVGAEVVDRFASNEFHRNPQWYKPFKLYLPLLLFGGGLWSFFEIRMIARLRLYAPRCLWAVLRGRGEAFFLLLWFLAPLTVFCLSQSRLPLYVLPLYAPLALAMARHIAQKCERAQPSIRKAALTRIVALTALSCAVIVAAKGESVRLQGKANTRVLYDLCVANAPGKNTVFVAFKDKGLNGLQFYLRGRLRRVDTSSITPGVEEYMKDIAREIQSRPPNRRYVFIADNDNAKRLGSDLGIYGLKYRIVKNRYWTLCVVK